MSMDPEGRSPILNGLDLVLVQILCQVQKIPYSKKVLKTVQYRTIPNILAHFPVL
jgi:hypothetical protein